MTTTDQQLSLDLRDFTTPEYAPEQTIAERFAAFHAANAWVADALEALAIDWLAHGGQRIGVKALAETLRWHHHRATHGEPFKINNSHVSHYSRLLLERHPEWSEVIETRTLRAA